MKLFNLIDPRSFWGPLILSSGLVAAIWATNYPPWLLDSLRAITLIEAALIMGITGAVAHRYFRNYRVAPSKARLLPTHVIRLGISVNGLTLTAVGLIVSRIGEPFEWYGAPIAFPAMTVLLAGLIDMIFWLPDRSAPISNMGRREEDHRER